MDIPPKYGKNLKHIRHQLGLTRRAVATLLNIEPSDVMAYEETRNAIPLEHVEKLCRFYNLEFDLFFENIREDTSLYDTEKYKSCH